MWNVLTNWITVAVVVPILITIGIGVLSMTPPEFTTAHICFTLSAAILMARLGWWLAFEQSESKFQLFLFAFIIFGIIGCLWLFSMKWITQREQKFITSTSIKEQKPAIIQPTQPRAEEIATEVAKMPLTKETTTDIQPRQPAIHIPHTQQPEQEGVPDIKISLIQEPYRYAPGLDVNGIKWNENYRQYIFTISNQSSKIELFDLRISLEFLWIIVKHSIEISQGTQEVKLSQQRTIGGIANRKDDITVDTFEYYVNNLEVNAVRLFPKGKFSVQLFLMKIPTEDASTGTVTLKFRYLDNGGNRIGKVSVFPVEFKNKTDHENMFIDTDHPITGDYKGHFIMWPKKPLLLK